ncbi:hypothetical protein SDC9_133170 [bioreactor metagenome]|uniref:DUF6537 domain-containing protein n=1 Tax=bioreactor metagenome TaxID=1076179 RepID=A0A645DA77_9ZZZZ
MFGRSEERRHERALVDSYESMIRNLLANLRADQHAIAVQIAQAALKVRGFGPVKEANRRAYETEIARLLQALAEPAAKREAVSA